MSVINPLSREISAKIVYYGPGLSGKTTTLKHIYKAVRPERRGELVSLATEGDRTIFFDFLPLHIERVRNMAVRMQLYTVPGQVFYAATRKLVLNGADGVVFVADSQKAARDANLESLQGLRENLADLGIDLESFPLVFQYNKRDLPEVMQVSQMTGELNFLGAPEFGSSATKGSGVLPVLKEIARLVIRSLWERQPNTQPVAVVEEKVEREAGLEAQLSSVTSRMEARSSSTSQASPAPRTPPRSAQAPGTGVSFRSLWPDSSEPVVVAVERAIEAKRYPEAVRRSAAGLADLLDSLPGPTGSDGPTAKASLLGLDGREYLRLCRLATAPEGAVNEENALFALYLLVAARIKSRHV